MWLTSQIVCIRLKFQSQGAGSETNRHQLHDFLLDGFHNFLSLEPTVTLVTSNVKGFSAYDWRVSKNSLREATIANVVRLLREEREQRGLSMNVVAQRSGLSHSIVSLIERDLRNPTLDTLLRITEAIGIDLGEVLTRARKELSKSAKP